jgi:uncharacterized membrane protein (DUF2068 family)
MDVLEVIGRPPTFVIVVLALGAVTVVAQLLRRLRRDRGDRVGIDLGR